MNKTLLLIKYDLISSYNSLNKKKKNTFTILTLIILSAIILASSFLFQTIEQIELLKDTEFVSLALTTPITTLVNFIALFIISKSTLSKENNTDFLLSLPIKKTSMVASKTIYSIVAYLLISLVVTIPSFIYYSIEISNTISPIINSIIVSILISCFFTGFGYLFNSFLNRFVIKFKFYKIIRMLLVTSTIGLFMFTSFSLQIDPTSLRIPVISTLVDIIINTNILEYFLLILISISSLIIGIIVFSKVYAYTPNIIKTNNTTLNYNTNSAFVTLLKKEFRNYFNSTMYLFQSIVGHILMIGLSISVFFINIDGLELMIYLILCFNLSITCTTNSSISLEGKNIWITKCAPIKTITILLSKISMNIIMLFSSVTLSFILLLISNKVEILTLILLYLFGLITSIFISCIGLSINLLLPKLDFTNETQVVKQSAASIISVLFFILFLTTPSFLYLIGIIPLSLNYMIITNISYLLILSIITMILIRTKGTKLFEKL